MKISAYSIALRELSDDYSHQRLEYVDYRMKRKIILDAIDLSFNNQDSNEPESENIKHPSPDATESMSGAFSKVFDVIKKKIEGI
ncbi:MAG: hypothetical protein COB30_012955 [Ectothiorhodospiraceae bacterium]|nr:hypothetical protein [Ectothiorhodospiraceae bacterium]